MALVMVLFFSLIAMLRCSAPSRLEPPTNIASIYNPSSSTFEPKFKLYHVNDSLSRLYVRFPLNDLQFSTWNSDEGEHALVDLKYLLRIANDSNRVVDSMRVQFQLKKNIEGYFVSNLPMRLKAGNFYTLEITSLDRYRGSKHFSFIEADKRFSDSREAFLLRTSNQMPLFEPYLRVGQTFRVESDHHSIDSIYVDFIAPLSKEAELPYYLSPSKWPDPVIDSTYVFAHTDTTLIQLEEEGLYLFRLQDTGRVMWSMPVFNSFYPGTRTSEQLLEPLTYLTMPREYRRLAGHPSLKAALDSFWLASTGNATRAKELIRVYYSRVYFANRYFADYREGWMSDRGMIYTIFGPPGTIYRVKGSERWIYGGNKNLSSMDFLFIRKENSWRTESYELVRQDLYKASWYQAVDTWRNGRIYSVQN